MMFSAGISDEEQLMIVGNDDDEETANTSLNPKTSNTSMMMKSD